MPELRQHPDHNLATPGFRTESEWEGMTTGERLTCLRPEDRAEVAPRFSDAERAARAAVQAEWLATHGDLRDPAVFRGWRSASGKAEAGASAALWVHFASGNDPSRCRHAASAGECHVRDCVNQWREPRHVKPSERYATGDVRRWVLERDQYRCQYCGREVDDNLPPDHESKANVDHVVPWPEGRTRVDNLVTACAPCNREKGIGPPDAFRGTPADEL